jgi:hypothetical protein
MMFAEEFTNELYFIFSCNPCDLSSYPVTRRLSTLTTSSPAVILHEPIDLTARTTADRSRMASSVSSDVDARMASSIG